MKCIKFISTILFILFYIPCWAQYNEFYKVDNNTYVITTAQDTFTAVKDALEAADVKEFLECELTYIPNMEVELDEEATVIVDVTGTNAVAAIYGEDFGGEGGPKANNNNKGNIAASSSTFFFDFNDYSLESFNLIEKDDVLAGYQNHQQNWHIEGNVGPDETGALVSYSYSYDPKINNANNIIVTQEYYNITSTSKLSFDSLLFNSAQLSEAGQT